MEHKIIETPIGHKVYFYKNPPYKIKRALTRMISKGMVIDANAAKQGKSEEEVIADQLNLDAFFDMQEQAVDLLVVKIEEHGKPEPITSDFFTAIGEWQEEDAEHVMQEINGFISPSTKKGA
jgi:hypothetical protein